MVRCVKLRHPLSDSKQSYMRHVLIVYIYIYMYIFCLFMHLLLAFLGEVRAPKQHKGRPEFGVEATIPGIWRGAT